jgi:hypothetical protein
LALVAPPVGVLAISESSRWLAKHGHDDETYAVLARTSDVPAEAANWMEDIKRAANYLNCNYFLVVRGLIYNYLYNLIN